MTNKTSQMNTQMTKLSKENTTVWKSSFRCSRLTITFNEPNTYKDSLCKNFDSTKDVFKYL